MVQILFEIFMIRILFDYFTFYFHNLGQLRNLQSSTFFVYELVLHVDHLHVDDTTAG